MLGERTIDLAAVNCPPLFEFAGREEVSMTGMITEELNSHDHTGQRLAETLRHCELKLGQAGCYRSHMNTSTTK